MSLRLDSKVNIENLLYPYSSASVASACQVGSVLNTVEQWFSTFLMLRPFNTVPHVVVTSNHKIISLLLHNCNFATVMNYNVNMQGI